MGEAKCTSCGQRPMAERFPRWHAIGSWCDACIEASGWAKHIESELAAEKPDRTPPSVRGTTDRFARLALDVMDRAEVLSAALKADSQPCPVALDALDGLEAAVKAARDAGWVRPEDLPMPPPAPPTDYEDLGARIGRLVAEKQVAYGDSYGRSGRILRELYPDGIRHEQFDDALAVVRVVDKLFRIATDRDALGESPWRDVAGYGLLGAARVDREQGA